MKLTKKELLNSPVREWNETERLYDQVLLVQGKGKHDSGYMHIVLIGAWKEKDEMKYEICCEYADDISWLFDFYTYGDRKEFKGAKVRMDCYYPQGVFRFHTRHGKFKIGSALSSVDVELIENLSNN